LFQIGSQKGVTTVMVLWNEASGLLPPRIAMSVAAPSPRTCRLETNAIVKGRRGVSADAALLLEALTRWNGQIWLTLQAKWDLWHALHARGKRPRVNAALVVFPEPRVELVRRELRQRDLSDTRHEVQPYGLLVCGPRPRPEARPLIVQPSSQELGDCFPFVRQCSPGTRLAIRLSNFFTATPRAHPWYNRGVPKPFSTAEVPDHPLTLTEAAESFGLSREAVTSIRTFVSAPARGSSTRRAKGGKAASSRKYSNSKKR
jgi:hypothetical protein